MRGRVVAVVIGLLAGACSTTHAPAPPPTDGSTPRTLTMQPAVDYVGLRAREPMVVEHPSGTLFVAGYGNESTPTLFKSGDGGASWQPVDVGTQADGALGNSDVDLAVAPDGTLYFASMTYDRKVLEGVRIAIGVSADVGRTWRWSLLSQTRFDDRPWVEVTPDGVAHVIWNDGDGVCHAVSRDRGSTWTELARVHPKGGSSHLAVGPNNEVAVRIVPLSASGNRFDPGVDLIAVSTDHGTSWRKEPAPGERTWVAMDDPRSEQQPRWVEPLAWDARGALYSMWGEGRQLWLARSTDQGRGWTRWPIAQAADQTYFPYLIAQGAGQLAATWFTGPVASLEAHVARIRAADTGAAPELAPAPPFRPDAWRRGQKPGEARARDTAGEYFPVAFLRDGSLGVVTTIQDDQRNRYGFSWWRAVEH